MTLAQEPAIVVPRPPAEDLLSVVRVSKRFGPILTLDDVSFGIGRGEIFGYIGPNGAGKTTTIKVIVGLIREFSGTVSIGGRPVADLPTGAPRDLGYLPQKAAFQEWRTVDQALRTFGRLSGLTSSDLATRIPQVLQSLGIADTRHRRIALLSGGTIQKVGMAQAILHRPTLLVLDEPMAGLDPVSRFQFKAMFQQLRDEGTTILFSSHILSDVEDIANRIGILSRGRLLHVGTVDEFRSRFGASRDVEILLSRDSGRPLDPSVLARLTGIDLVAPGRLRAHVRPDVDMDETIEQLISGLHAAGHRIRSIRPVLPSLEELYVRFVGGTGE